MITINQNRNHPPEPRTWKLMLGRWNVGVSAYFQGRISLAVRGAKKKTVQAGGAPGRAREPKQVDPKTCRGQSSNWIEKKWDRKKRPKNYQKDSSQDALPKIFHWIFQPQCFRCYTSAPRRGNSLQNILPGWWFCPSSMEIDDDRKLHFHQHGLEHRWEAQILDDFVYPPWDERWVCTWKLMVSKTSFIGSPGLCFKCYMFVLGRVGVGTWQTRTCVFTRFMTYNYR